MTLWMALFVAIGSAQSVDATLCSDPWYISPFDAEPINRPGQQGYDAVGYGQQLFDRYESAVFSDDRIIVIGTFSRRSAEPFFHETLLEETGTVGADAGAVVPLESEFYYHDAYAFSGVGVGDGRLVPISDRAVHLRILVSEGGSGAGPLEDNVPYMMAVYSSDGIEIEVRPHWCPDYRVPAPDDVALQVFMQCVADRGCR